MRWFESVYTDQEFHLPSFLVLPLEERMYCISSLHANRPILPGCLTLLFSFLLCAVDVHTSLWDAQNHESSCCVLGRHDQFIPTSKNPPPYTSHFSMILSRSVMRLSLVLAVALLFSWPPSNLKTPWVCLPSYSCGKVRAIVLFCLLCSSGLLLPSPSHTPQCSRLFVALAQHCASFESR
jgi:hypothetical protein